MFVGEQFFLFNAPSFSMLQTDVQGQCVFSFQCFPTKATHILGVEMTGFDVIASIPAFSADEQIAFQATMAGFFSGLVSMTTTY